MSERVKEIDFESVHGTRLRLARESDGEVWLEIFRMDGKTVHVDASIDPADMIAKLREIVRD